MSLICRTLSHLHHVLRFVSFSLEHEFAYQMVVREPKSSDSDDHSVGSTLGGFFDYHADEPLEFIAEKHTPPIVPKLVAPEPKSTDGDDHPVYSALGGIFDYRAGKPPEFMAEKHTPPKVP